MNPRGDLAEIRVAANARVDGICRNLLPRGRLEGGQWVAHNPRVAGDDRKTPALKVRVTGGDAGAWTDHRNGRDGYAGDIIGLVGYLNATDTKGALAWLRDFLGLRAMSREERDAMRFAAEAQAKKDEKRAREKRLWSLQEADGLFATPWGRRNYGPALCEGTRPYDANAAVWRHVSAYFRARKCALEEISTINLHSFRASAGTEWWKGAVWKTDEHGRKRKEANGPMFPALHSGMRSPVGLVTACHVTFLDPAAPAKAPVDNPKLMFGEKKGAIIEIATGPSSKPFWAAEEAGDVIICEGIETGASLAGALSAEARVWAAGDINNMGEVPAWLPCVGRLFLAHDRVDNTTSGKQLDQVIEKLEAHGKRLARMQSHVGSDFNDLGKGEDA